MNERGNSAHRNPVDKVVMVEPAGADSQVVKLIRIDRERN